MSATNSPGSRPSAVVFGCSGLTLTEEEQVLFKASDPLGFILFARNVEAPNQVRALVAELRACVGRNAPVLIDQEGGRVQRLRPPYWRSAPPLRQFGDLYAHDPERAARALRINMQAIGAELADLGIDVDCAPCLDVPVQGAHDVIGNRALSEDPEVVAALAASACDGLIDAGVVPVIKHLPGHGRAGVDSHKELPVIDAPEEALANSDLLPFQAVAQLPVAAMTAHVVYQAFDRGKAATLSTTVVSNVIRARIGFDGLLMSDDLGMKALNGSFEELAAASIKAGCDVVLHCSGDLAEMEQIAAGSSKLSNHAYHAMEELDRYRGAPRVEIDRTDASFEVASLLEVAA
ncbi:MAG: beta-N-acetylhexosaminidase [Rhodospirillaceae bacterium]|nr:beta-N-acetylhexosaminidase [Rhodospirillaceae bacterium]